LALRIFYKRKCFLFIVKFFNQHFFQAAAKRGFQLVVPIRSVVQAKWILWAMTFLPICLLCSLVWLSISRELSCREEQVWCGVAMPTKSYFGFDPPVDLELWKKAQAIAASGEPIFAKQI
jgi:hypothetical protein